eukprot:1853525-Rhodomonas_salina.1
MDGERRGRREGFDGGGGGEDTEKEWRKMEEGGAPGRRDTAPLGEPGRTMPHLSSARTSASNRLCELLGVTSRHARSCTCSR